MSSIVTSTTIMSLRTAKNSPEVLHSLNLEVMTQPSMVPLSWAQGDAADSRREMLERVCFNLGQT